jgi:hypothetical protein
MHRAGKFSTGARPLNYKGQKPPGSENAYFSTGFIIHRGLWKVFPACGKLVENL